MCSPPNFSGFLRQCHMCRNLINIYIEQKIIIIQLGLICGDAVDFWRPCHRHTLTNRSLDKFRSLLMDIKKKLCSTAAGSIDMNLCFSDAPIPLAQNFDTIFSNI